MIREGDMDMNKNMRKTIVTGIMFLLFAILAFHAPAAQAKKHTPSLSKKNVSLKKGKKIKISIKNASPKKTKWTVSKKGKSIVSLASKKKKTVTIKGKKAGTAAVTAKLTLKNRKKKTLRVKVKVAGKTVTKNPDPGNIDGAGKEPEVSAFPGSIKATLTDAGYVKLQWTWVSDAEFYVLQRRTGTGNWEELKNTSAVACTDKTVAENTQYQYRVKAEYKGMKTTAFSSPVAIRTGKVNGSVTADPNPTPEPTAKPDPKPTEDPEDKPYEAKYTYEVEVLNRFTIYENVPIALFVKTDNPDPNDFDNVYVSFGEDYKGGQLCTFEDIKYLESEKIKSTDFDKVKGGWIYTLWFSSPGIKNVSIEELDKSGERNIWRKVDTFQIEVQDGEKGLQEHCNNIIKTVSNESYNEDGLGKWSALSGQQKMERLEEYVVSHMNYPRLGAETSLGYLPVWIIQENVGAFWETGFADCGAANEMMCVLARTLGYEAHRLNTTLNGGLHIVAMVTIDGEEYKYDATPWQGGYKDYDYIL